MEHSLTLTPTLSVVEMNAGDTLVINHPAGNTQILELQWANAVIRKSGKLPYIDGEGVIQYGIKAAFTLDGQPVQLSRTIPCQTNFRPPAAFMGLHIYLDATQDISNFLGQHGPSSACFPKRDCRLVIWKAGQRICPPLIHPWCPLPEGQLRLNDCYRGEDVWMGPYDGTECHGGLDINHPAGTPLWTPISIHEHELFARVNVDGANNNRWRGWHHWPDGKSWFLQAHHMIRLLVNEDAPLEAGIHYAEAAGVLSGAYEHSHFVFGVRDTAGESMMIDPWLLFYQMYEDRKLTTA